MKAPIRSIFFAASFTLSASCFEPPECDDPGCNAWLSGLYSACLPQNWTGYVITDGSLTPSPAAFARNVSFGSDGAYYISGTSFRNFGAPLNPHNTDGVEDSLLVRMDAYGRYLWHTCLGSALSDNRDTIGAVIPRSTGAVNAFEADGAFGSPMLAFNGGGGSDVAVAAYSESGALRWLTFTGAAASTSPRGGLANESGFVLLLISGGGFPQAGPALNAPHGFGDAVLLQMNDSGALGRHYFIGPSAGGLSQAKMVRAADGGYALALQLSGDLAPEFNNAKNARAGGDDVAVVKLDSNWNYQWHRYLGNPLVDKAGAIVDGGDGFLYVGGTSEDTIAGALQPHGTPGGGNYDGFIARIRSSDGALDWVTHLGIQNGATTPDTVVFALAPAPGAMLTVSNSSQPFGNPRAPFSTGMFGQDTGLAAFGANGSMLWNTFLNTGSGFAGFHASPTCDGGLAIGGFAGFRYGNPVNASPHALDFALLKLGPQF